VIAESARLGAHQRELAPRLIWLAASASLRREPPVLVAAFFSLGLDGAGVGSALVTSLLSGEAAGKNRARMLSFFASTKRIVTAAMIAIHFIS
jgi:hypothetical protein